ncbi:MAG: hypothetical protein MZU97_16690 [Bacillus subtilis]|nr:hypothetical protein [Bacillus subtilis]
MGREDDATYPYQSKNNTAETSPANSSKLANNLSFVKEHADVDIGNLYTTKLSEDFAFQSGLIAAWIACQDHANGMASFEIDGKVRT